MNYILIMSCRRWLPLTNVELLEHYDGIYHTVYGMCTQEGCHSTTQLYLLHVEQGMGEAYCYRCDKDVDIKFVCHNRIQHKN